MSTERSAHASSAQAQAAAITQLEARVAEATDRATTAAARLAESVASTDALSRSAVGEVGALRHQLDAAVAARDDAVARARQHAAAEEALRGEVCVAFGCGFTSPSPAAAPPPLPPTGLLGGRCHASGPPPSLFSRTVLRCAAFAPVVVWVGRWLNTRV